MSFQWANTLLFQLSGSKPPAAGHRGDESPARGAEASDFDYDRLMAVARLLDPAWRTITLNLPRDGDAPIPVQVDTGSGGQPQKRSQYLLNRESGAVLRVTRFTDGSRGQRWRAFVRFGHTGEWYGAAGQAIAMLVSLGACLLVCTGLALSVRRLAASLRRRANAATAEQKRAEEAAVS